MVAGPWFLLAAQGISPDGMWGFPVSLLLPQPPQVLGERERVKGGYRWLSGVCQCKCPWSVARAGIFLRSVGCGGMSPMPAVLGWRIQVGRAGEGMGSHLG